MKRFLLIFITIFSIFWTFLVVNWASWDIEVVVTEKIPWANCSEEMSSPVWANWPQQSKPTWNYKCIITPWFWTIQMMIWWIIKWVTALAALTWVLFIVINWIMLSMHGWEATKIKDRITKTIIWLILLLLSWVILSIIAPWVYK